MIENLLTSYKLDGYADDVVEKLLDDEYKGIDWRNIFETYYNAKKGL